MYEVQIRKDETDILKTLKFNTKQELDEYIINHPASSKIVINNFWYKVRYIRKIGSEIIVGVSSGD